MCLLVFVGSRIGWKKTFDSEMWFSVYLHSQRTWCTIYRNRT